MMDVVRFVVGVSFEDLFLRAAVAYERAARAFRSQPETRSFLLQQAAAFRQTSLTPLLDVEAVWRSCEAILVATEHYLDEVEAMHRPENVIHFPKADA